MTEFEITRLRLPWDPDPLRHPVDRFKMRKLRAMMRDAHRRPVDKRPTVLWGSHGARQLGSDDDLRLVLMEHILAEHRREIHRAMIFGTATNPRSHARLTNITG